MIRLKNLGLLLIIFVTNFLLASQAEAQVNIGSKDAPKSFSMLELSTDKMIGGLRMPHLTTKERDDLNLKNLSGDKADAAKGLIIYNISIECLEFWNGSNWISLCSNVKVDCSSATFPYLGDYYTLCNNSTIADLNAFVGGNVKWYLQITDTSPCADNMSLGSNRTFQLYAEQTDGLCKKPIKPVSVTVGDCNATPTGINITTFTNVMYDFQHQALEAYRTGGGVIRSYKWQVSSDYGNNFTPIPGALNSPFLKIPAKFANSYPVDTLYFNCVVSNDLGSWTTPNLNIMFINTSHSDYGIDKNGVRYLTIQRAFDGGVIGTTKIALLSLGQSGTGSLNPNFDDSHNLNDAGDFGDLYEWGRIPDGHQHVAWNKNPTTRVNQITPMTGGSATSALVAKPATPPYSFTSTGQIPNDVTAEGYYGKFIILANQTWGNGANNLWGTTTLTRPASDISYPENNPCPTGWRVPTRFHVWDIMGGNGANDPTTVSLPGGVYTGVNTFQIRASSNNAYGGVIINNSNNNKVFLPASGYRVYTGDLTSGATVSVFWSSTYSTTGVVSALGISFSSSLNNSNQTGYHTAQGLPVRCFSETD